MNKEQREKAFRQFFVTRYPQASKALVKEAKKQGLHFKRGYTVEVQPGGAILPVPDFCAKPDGSADQKLVGEWGLALHKVIREEWEVTYEGMKAMLFEAIDAIPDEEDRKFMRSALVCDDAAQTFGFTNGDSDRVGRLLTEMRDNLPDGVGGVH